jgi:predicted transposase YdaD
MTTPSVVDYVRHFRENGLKLLFQHPGNTRDLLTLARAGKSVIERIDFRRMTVDNTTYVASDFRHLSADLVLKAPFRTGVRGHSRIITLYILLEHQSEPDGWMLFRVLDYLVQIWKGQLRTREAELGSAAGFRLQPVVPIVLYTGSAAWNDLGRLIDRMEVGEQFKEMIPEFQPLFVSLAAISGERLESEAGYLGWVLELLQQRRARPEEYAGLVGRVMTHLEQMPRGERSRWLQLLSYIRAMIYHDREPSEQDQLSEQIANSVRSDEHRAEVRAMAQSMADYLIEKGRAEGLEKGRSEGAVAALQQALLGQLRLRFGKIPRATERAIFATDDLARLQSWIDRFATATSLADVGIGPAAR